MKQLTDEGEARIRGYLFVLSRSLSSFMSKEVARDSAREVETHIRERVAEVVGVLDKDEREVLEGVLTKLGDPMKIAQAYATEYTFNEAVTTGRPLAVFRALWLMFLTAKGFVAALLVFSGYAISGITFLMAMAFVVLKPFFPQLVFRVGFPMEAGPTSSTPEAFVLVPIAMLFSAITLAVTHVLARRLVAWWRGRLNGALES